MKGKKILRKKEEITLKLRSLPGIRVFVWITPWSRNLSRYQVELSEVSQFCLTQPRPLPAVQVARHRHFVWSSDSKQITCDVFSSWQPCLLCTALSRLGPSYHQKCQKE